MSDFVVFPRRFCKSETFGVGMMDGGVGSFIISHAITSIHARGGGGGSGGSGGAVKGAQAAPASARGMLSQLWRITRSILPLLVLGVLRLFTIRATEYQQHVSEYGVHWNFFFTLAAVALLSASMSRAIHARSAALMGFGLLLAFQFALSSTYTDLTHYLMHAPRLSLFSANKEGIWSSLGYFGIYLFAVRFGFELLGRQKSLPEWGRKFASLLVGARPHARHLPLPARRLARFLVGRRTLQQDSFSRAHKSSSFDAVGNGAEADCAGVSDVLLVVVFSCCLSFFFFFLSAVSGS